MKSTDNTLESQKNFAMQHCAMNKMNYLVVHNGLKYMFMAQKTIKNAPYIYLIEYAKTKVIVKDEKGKEIEERELIKTRVQSHDEESKLFTEKPKTKAKQKKVSDTRQDDDPIN